MSRLPTPGSDDGTWGTVLNDFLGQAHAADGTLKASSVGASQVQDGTISSTKLDTATQTALSGKLTASSNLSDLASAATARTNLGADNASNITSGTLSSARLPDLSATYAHPVTVQVSRFTGYDPTGATFSDAAVTSALAVLGSSVGHLEFGPGTFKLANTITLSVAGQGIIGSGADVTTLTYTGSGDALRIYQSTFQSSKAGGRLVGFTLDGTTATSGANGLHYGDLVRGVIDDVSIKSFTGGIGAYFHNLTGWTEKAVVEISTGNCLQNVVFDGENGASTTSSFDYSTWCFRIFANANQDGMALQKGAVLLGCRLEVTFNATAGSGSNTGRVLVVGTATETVASGIVDSTVHFTGESNSSGVSTPVGHQTINIGIIGIFRSGGVLAFNGGPWQTGVNSSAKFSFAGRASVDSLFGKMAGAQAALFSGGIATRPGIMDINTGTGAINLDIASGKVFKNRLGSIAHTMTFNSTSLTAMNGSATDFEIFLFQPASGAAGTVTWPSGMTWLSGNPPMLSTANNAVDHIRVVSIDQFTFWGMHMNPAALGFGFPATLDVGAIRSGDFIALPAANTAIYARCRDGGTISKVAVNTSVQSGNISVAAYSNTGSGRSAAPGTRLATSGAVACPAGYSEVSLGSTITMQPGDWLCLTADNATATFRTLLAAGADNNFGLGRQYRQATAHPAPSPVGTLVATIGYTFVLVGAP
jgi:hypothetical protein